MSMKMKLMGPIPIVDQNFTLFVLFNDKNQIYQKTFERHFLNA